MQRSMPVSNRLMCCVVWVAGCARSLAFSPPASSYRCFNKPPAQPVWTIARRKSTGAPLFPRFDDMTGDRASSARLRLRFFQDNDDDELDEQVSSSSVLPSQQRPSLLDGSASGLMNSIPSNLSSMLMPLAVVLDETTDGWALTYADLSPETEMTPLGASFLATNLAYTIVGVLLQLHGEVLLGTLTEVASVASFAYHFGQLNLGPDQAPVRVALLLDYVVAGCTLLTAASYLVTSNLSEFPTEALVAMALAVVFLGLSWVWEKGWRYIVNHGLWHLFGAYAGYVIGTVHILSSSSSQS